MMKMSRQKLRPWLEGILNQDGAPGTYWIDKEIMKFRLPWPRVSDDENPYRQIFEKWAVHNGKYRQGIDNKEFSKWKARLRCAMNKAKDISLIKEESRPDDPEDPFNIYCFANIENENDVNKIHFFESDRERKQQPRISCLLGIQKLQNSQSENNFNLEQSELPTDLRSIESSDLISMETSIDFKKYISEIPEKLDSLQIRETNPIYFEVYLEIDFENTLKFEEKLASSNHGFFISPERSCEEKYENMQIIELDLLELNKEFSPGLILSVDGGSIYGHSLVKAPLLCKKVGSKGLITSKFILNNDKMLLLKDQDNPTEQVRKVIISKSEGVLEIAIRTKLLPDSIKNKDDIEQLERNELHPMFDNTIKVIELSNPMETEDALSENITFDNLEFLENSSIGYCHESCMHSSLNS